jgi:replicative DNA helicase
LEEAVLGALMLDKDALPIVIDIIRAESFYTEAHQAIYKAMLKLFEKSQPIDLLTVTEEVKKQGELEKIGGPYYLVELTNRVASSANIEYHARIIAQKHIQRELIRVSTDVIRDAYEDTTDVFDLLDKAEQGLFQITEQNLSRTYEGMGTLLSKAIKQLEELAQKEEGLTGVPTGFTALDRLTSGWQPSDLIIVAARPGMGKCLGKGTKIIMFDGSIKNVEDVKVGDLLMGDDSTPRKVMSLARGREQMYWVRQNKGIDYRVNESHILSLKKSRQEGKGNRGDVLNISIKDYLEKSNKFKTNYKGYKVAVEFDEKSLEIAPYFLGIWLGDGTASDVSITTQDEEVIKYLNEYASILGYSVTERTQVGKTTQYSIIAGGQGHKGISLQGTLRDIGVLNNKHIPEQFLVNSTENRLELLAGLLDSDGHYLIQSNGFEITQKNKRLACQIKYLCDSLGFRTSLKSKKASIASINYETTVWRIRIYGDIDKIPVRIQRKKANPWKSIVDWHVTGITVEKDIVDDYYGFEIDGNKLFLLEDMTVTHNTSFTLALARNAALEFSKPVAFFSLEMSNLQLVQRLISLEAEISGSKLRNGRLEDYEWQQLHSSIEKMGEMKIFIDDTPGINIFELRAKCRRLKMQHDIQMVIIDYLQLMTGGGDKKGGNREQEISMISRSLKGLAKELNVPVIALSQLSRAVETRGGAKRPQLSDLRESGAIEQDADIVSFIYRPEYYQIMEDEEGNSQKGVAEIIVAKHRNGATDTVKLKFISEYAKFADLEDDGFGNFDDNTSFDDDGNNIITLGSRMNDDDIPF